MVLSCADYSLPRFSTSPTFSVVSDQLLSQVRLCSPTGKQFHSVSPPPRHISPRHSKFNPAASLFPAGSSSTNNRLLNVTLLVALSPPSHATPQKIPTTSISQKKKLFSLAPDRELQPAGRIDAHSPFRYQIVARKSSETVPQTKCQQRFSHNRAFTLYAAPSFRPSAIPFHTLGSLRWCVYWHHCGPSAIACSSFPRGSSGRPPNRTAPNVSRSTSRPSASRLLFFSLFFFSSCSPRRRPRQNETKKQKPTFRSRFLPKLNCVAFHLPRPPAILSSL